MAQDIVSIVYQIKDMASAGLASIQSGLSNVGVAANKAAIDAKNVQQRFEGLGAAGKTVAIGAGIVSAGLGAIGWAAIKAAGDFEQQKIAFETMLGSAEKAKILLGQLKDLAATTPFEYTDIVNYSKQLLAMGISAGDVTTTIKMLGDISAGVGADKLPQLVNALGQVNAAQKLTGQDLLQFTNAGVPLLGELAKQYGVTAGEARQMVSDGKVGFKDVENALKGMTGEGGKFFNLMGRQSATLTGQVSNLSDSVGFLSRGFGDALLPAIKPVVAGIRSLVQFFSELSPTTKTVVAVLGTLAFGIAALATGLGAVAAILPTIASGMAILGVSMRALAGASGIGLLIAAFTTLGVVVYKNWDYVKSTIASGALYIVEALDSVVVSIDKILKKYNDMVGKIPGIPRIAIGTDEAIKGLDALESKLKTIASQKLPISKGSFAGGGSGTSSPVPTGPTNDELKDSAKAFKDFSKSILQNHEEMVQAMIEDNKYSFDWEISALKTLRDTHVLTEEDNLKVSRKINSLSVKSREDASNQKIRVEEAAISRLKTLGDISIQQERDRLALLAADESLSAKQREELTQKLYDLDAQLALEKRARDQFLFSEEQKALLEIEELKKKGINNELQLQKIFLDGARNAGNEKLSIEKQIANGILDYYKKQVIAEVDAMAARWTIEAWGRIAGSWGFDAGAWGLLAAAGAASAGIRSALSGIQLAEGGIVMPQNGGVRATIAEAGSPEAVIPLDDPKAMAMLGGGSRIEKIVLDADGTAVLAKAIYRKQQYLQRTGQLSGGLI